MKDIVPSVPKAKDDSVDANTFHLIQMYDIVCNILR
jgi:hypothetical protein